MGAQWLSGRVLDSRPRGRGFEPHRRHCVVTLSKNINPSLVLVQPRHTRPYITERLLMGRKESNQTNYSQDVHLLKYFKGHLIIFLRISEPDIIGKPYTSIDSETGVPIFFYVCRLHQIIGL